MSERWVKATLQDGQFAKGERWVNVGYGTMIRLLTGDSGGTGISVAGMNELRFVEPPEHFLPPLTVGADQITAFVRRLAFMEDSETIKPDGTAIVREARRLIEELREAETRDWVIRTYSGIRASS